MAGVLIVTGGSRGIGAATAKLGAARGYRVAVNYNRNPASAEAVVKEIEQSGGRAIAIQADVSREADVVRLFETVDRELGRVSALFNNAGVIHRMKPITDFAEAELAEMWRVNITSQFLCAREAAKRMSTKLGGEGGAIVNMSSAAARLGGANGSLAYAASKGAIDTFTTGLALELAPQGIRVTGVRPGLIDTTIHNDMGDPDRLAKLRPTVPLGRTGRVEEVAEAVLWLLSPQASYVTNTIIDIGGGR
ncbi:MAG TPA: SDR family oxidoreductase [Hyphomicrobiaceae bacterium]|jgi:NAD(P)-dependent dehydrogenase (short-subunit alcohol dehydrogenase family)